MTSPPPGPPGTTPPGSSGPPPGSGPGETPPLGPAANDPSVRNRNIILGVTLLVVGVAVGVLIAFIVRDDANDSAKKKVTTTTSSSTSTTTEPTTTTTSTTTEPTTTTAAPKAPVINSFSIPSTVDCPTNQPVPITLSWSTSHAESVALSIDGPGIYGTYPANGSTQVNFPCDGASHLYRLAARANGQPDAVQSKTVNPTSGP